MSREPEKVQLVPSEAHMEKARKAARSARSLLLIGIILAGLLLLGVLSSVASLVVYDIPFGTEFKNAHTYWALIPAFFGTLTVFIAAVGLFRNMSGMAYLVSFAYSIFYAAVLVAIFVITMVDIFTCDAPDWWCVDVGTGAVSWRYWWYAASAWLQLLAIVPWIVVVYFMHRAIRTAARGLNPNLSKRRGGIVFTSS